MNPAAVEASPAESAADERSTAVWRQWLSSMASDAEAALAAAIAYRDMDAESRESWLRSLKLDAPEVDVPPVALYAPLLAVESDPERRKRLLAALGDDAEEARASSYQSALTGGGKGAAQVFVLILPLYLDFVQVLACAVHGGLFQWVRHDPIVNVAHAPQGGDKLDGVRLEPTPVKSVIDDLAWAVLSHRRSGRALPEALEVLADLLVPHGP